ncbi:MAG: hypothetical protein AB7L09_22285 [Nitrospira sp.]
MTVFNPLPDNTSTIAPKVKWGAIAAYVVTAGALGLYRLLTQDDNALLLEILPDSIEWLILPIVPMLSSLIAGYAARHQWREAEVTTATE